MMDPGLVKFVEFLNRNKVRTTYRAVADAADVPHRSVGALLAESSLLASWVVNASSGEPTGYSENGKHPDVHPHREIIRSGEELIRRMKREKR